MGSEEESSPQKSTNEALEDLNHPDPARRIAVLNSIKGLGLRNPRILSELRLTAHGDPDPGVRAVAKSTLKSFGVKLQPQTKLFSANINKGDFWMGVGLWFALNILLFFCSGTQYALYRPSMRFLPLIINIGLLIFFAFARPQIAYGMLVGFGSFLVIVLCLGVVTLAYCFLTPNNFYR